MIFIQKQDVISMTRILIDGYPGWLSNYFVEYIKQYPEYEIRLFKFPENNVLNYCDCL